MYNSTIKKNFQISKSCVIICHSDIHEKIRLNIELLKQFDVRTDTRCLLLTVDVHICVYVCINHEIHLLLVCAQTLPCVMS